MKLVVFDLDGTLTRTNAVDNECYVRAFTETLQLKEFNRDWSSYDHVTDEGVARQIFVEHFARHPAPEETARILEHFVSLLRESCDSDPSGFAEIPGAGLMLQWLREQEDWAVAVATGSWQGPAELKVLRSGLQIADLPSAFAEDGPSRESIVRTAIGRAAAANRQSRFDRIISVGDALWDVKTARTLGLPFLGIAQGTRAALLRDNGASHVIADYRNPDQCIQYLNEVRVP